MERGRIARNVATLVDAPSLDLQEVQPLTAAEARALLGAATGERDAARWLWRLLPGQRSSHRPRQDWARWQALLAMAGVRDARLHDARHTATLLLSQNVPARVVMEMLGHSQISRTLGTYSHVAPELATDAAERMGRAL